MFLTTGLSACASQTLQIPDCEVKAAEISVQKPLPLPELSDPDVSRGTAVFTQEQFAALTRYLVVSGGNYDIAQANAEALAAQSEAFNEMRDCSEFQRKFSEVREEQLEQERRDHFIDVWFRNGIIAIGILGAVL